MYGACLRHATYEYVWCLLHAADECYARCIAYCAYYCMQHWCIQCGMHNIITSRSACTSVTILRYAHCSRWQWWCVLHTSPSLTWISLGTYILHADIRWNFGVVLCIAEYATYAARLSWLYRSLSDLRLLLNQPPRKLGGSYFFLKLYCARLHETQHMNMAYVVTDACIIYTA
jgi:hypothetical protein